MTFVELRKTVPVQLPNGAFVKVDVTNVGPEDIGSDKKQFQPVADAVEGGVQIVGTPIQKRGRRR